MVVFLRTVLQESMQDGNQWRSRQAQRRSASAVLVHVTHCPKPRSLACVAWLFGVPLLSTMELCASKRYLCLSRCCSALRTSLFLAALAQGILCFCWWNCLLLCVEAFRDATVLTLPSCVLFAAVVAAGVSTRNSRHASCVWFASIFMFPLMCSSQLCRSFRILFVDAPGFTDAPLLPMHVPIVGVNSLGQHCRCSRVIFPGLIGHVVLKHICCPTHALIQMFLLDRCSPCE